MAQAAARRTPEKEEQRRDERGRADATDRRIDLGPGHRDKRDRGERPNDATKPERIRRAGGSEARRTAGSERFVTTKRMIGTGRSVWNAKGIHQRMNPWECVATYRRHIQLGEPAHRGRGRLEFMAITNRIFLKPSLRSADSTTYSGGDQPKGYSQFHSIEETDQG